MLAGGIESIDTAPVRQTTISDKQRGVSERGRRQSATGKQESVRNTPQRERARRHRWVRRRWRKWCGASLCRIVVVAAAGLRRFGTKNYELVLMGSILHVILIFYRVKAENHYVMWKFGLYLSPSLSLCGEDISGERRMKREEEVCLDRFGSLVFVACACVHVGVVGCRLGQEKILFYKI